MLVDRLGLKVSAREKLITWRKLSIKFVLCKERQEQMEKKQRKKTNKPINKERGGADHTYSWNWKLSNQILN